MKLSANKAHKLAHVSKKTLLKALENGTLSGEKNNKGHWLIDQSELLRVFPENRFGLSTSQPETPSENASKTHQNNTLEVELKFMREKLDDKDVLIEELRSQRDKWQLQAERLLLEKPVTPAPEPVATKPTNQNTPPEAEKPSRGVLARLFGG